MVIKTDVVNGLGWFSLQDNVGYSDYYQFIIISIVS